MKSKLGNCIAISFVLLMVTACGGGGGGSGASVATLTATPVQYSRTMAVTVFGTGLLSTTVDMIVEGPCSTVSRTAGGTDLQQQYTCTINGLGDLIPRIRTADGVELASMRLNVPLPQVTMTVTQGARTGTYVLELDPVAAPVTVNNFLTYLNLGYYKSTLFHRVVPNFVVQAGGYIAGPTVKPAILPAIVSEAGNGLKNLRGTVAMARTSDANSATSQFFINLVDNPDLDFGSSANAAGYTVFGKVVSGQDVVDEIGKVPTTTDVVSGLANLPVTNVVITAATQTK